MEDIEHIDPEGLFSRGSETLLILGNGFDLNLGLPTSYKQFCQEALPFVRGGYDYGDLGKLIMHATTISRWYDLENILAVYGSSRSFDIADCHEREAMVKRDRMDYNMLVNSLSEYLNGVDYDKVDESSYAARILKAVNDNILPGTIYTFNYTDLNSIEAKLGVSKNDPTYVHGNLKDNNIILGVGDYVKLVSEEDFMYKTNNANYICTNLFHDLAVCKNIIIFGLSMSQVDYPYFEDFFKAVASGSYDEDKKKYIRIITYDDNAMSDIYRNLRGMNNGMIKLRNYSDFDVIRTKDSIDEDKINMLIDHINPKIVGIDV